MKKKVFAVILAAAAICGSLSPVYAADSELVLYTYMGRNVPAGGSGRI